MTVTQKLTKKTSLNGAKKVVKKTNEVHPLEALRLLVQKVEKREGVKLKPFKRA